MKLLSFLFAAGSIIGCHSANAAQILFEGGGVLSYPSFTQQSTPSFPIYQNASSSGFGFTFGLLSRFQLINDFQLETGLSYLQRAYTLSIQSGSTLVYDETLKMIRIPLLIRYSIWQNFSVGLGGYFAHGLGDVADTHISISGSGPVSDQENSYDYLQYNRNEFGLEGCLGVDLPVAPAWGAVVDLRYLLGLTDIGAGSTSSVRQRDFLFQAGFRYSLGM